jgi:UDP-glucose 4-epimerase
MDVRKSVANPMSDAMTNVLGTISVLAAANLSGCARMVNASTGGAIYGEGGGRAAVESDPLLPEAPYGQSKHSAEGYCDLYNRMYDLSTVSLRFGNVYGPRQNPAGEAGVIAIFCGLILDGAPITVFGDGKQTRDYVYVDDVVAGAIAAADSEAVGAFNLGTGRPTSILDLIDGLEAVIRSEVDYLSAPHRPGELEHIHLDTERTAQTLGWRSEVDLSDGLRQTLDWFRSAANAHADYKV